jgi:hypothetical protein
MRRSGTGVFDQARGVRVHRETKSQVDRADEVVVVLWKGYVTGQFQAFRPPGVEPFLCSRPFRMWRPPWQPKLPLDESPLAAVALEEITAELTRRGWQADGVSDGLQRRVFVKPPEVEKVSLSDVGPARIAEPFLLRALDQVAGESGATAAEVGRALYGDDASSVRQLPQRIGSRLRRLQLQGKVDRYEANGVSRWFRASPDRKDGAAAHSH